MQSLTYSQVQILVSNNQLTPGELYYITDKNVILTAISNNQFSAKGIYLYSHGAKAWGAIQLTDGTGGSVNTITVNGTNIMSGIRTYIASTYTDRMTRNDNIHGRNTSFSYNDSLLKTAAGVAANINSAQSNYVAYAVRDWIVIQSAASGTTPNGYTISGTGSNIILGNAISMNGGTANPTNPISYECNYDFTNDILYRLFDPIYNNEICQDSNFQATNGNSILDFNWNQANVYNNRFYNSIIYPNFLDSTSKFYSNEATDIIIGANMLQVASLVYEQRLKTAEFQQNRLKSGSICMGNELTGGFGYDGGTGLFNVESAILNFNLFDNAKVTSNKMYGGAWFKYNEFSSNGFFTSNKMTWFSEFSCNTDVFQITLTDLFFLLI